METRIKINQIFWITDSKEISDSLPEEVEIIYKKEIKNDEIGVNTILNDINNFLHNRYGYKAGRMNLKVIDDDLTNQQGRV